MGTQVTTLCKWSFIIAARRSFHTDSVFRGVHEERVAGEESDETETQVTTKSRGTWAESDTEKALKAVIGFTSKYSGISHHTLLLIEVITSQLLRFDGCDPA